MQNKWRIFFALGATILPILARSQDNTKGDRAPATNAIVSTEKASHRIHLTRVEKRRQRLAFRKPKVENTARYEFYKRVEEAAKEKQRILKKLSKPQYSDFAYFGHKQKPKKHKPYQIKYCKECGIRH